MRIKTEPIGSIPRPIELVLGLKAHAAGQINDKDLQKLFESALADTIKHLEATGSPVISDGEQTKPSFATYPIAGMSHLDPNGVIIPFADGHTRQLPTITAGPFRYKTYAGSYSEKAKKLTSLPVKQAVISVSAMSLLYPQGGIKGYSREEFTNDLIDEAEDDIRSCLNAGAYNVQVDFTEGRLALKLDPSGNLLKSFIDLNNKVLERFSEADRKRIGVHSCPGGDHDSTHSADVEYSSLLPLLFSLKAGQFYLEFAGEKDKPRVLAAIKENLQPSQTIFLGVINVLDPRVEKPEEVRDTILQATSVLPIEQIGTTDDCGFSPFADDISTSREIAFAKIKARIAGTKLAESVLEKKSVHM